MTSLAMALQDPYELRAGDIDRFGEQGFVKLSGFIDPDFLASHESEITTKVIELNTMHLPLEQRSTYNKAFLQVGNLWKHSEFVREFVYSRRLAQVAAELLGVQGVRLYFDQALYKEQGGGITPWHADQYYWPLSSDRSCTAWIPLQDTPLAMGPLTFAAGSHRFEYGRDLPISDESEQAMQAALGEQDFQTVEEPYALGDVSIHLGWTFHRAGANSTDRPRRVMTVAYIDADMALDEPVNDHQRAAIEASFPDLRPGDPIDTPGTPVLYRRGDDEIRQIERTTAAWTP